MYECVRCGNLYHHDDSPCLDGDLWGYGKGTLLCEDCTQHLEAEYNDIYGEEVQYP